MNKPNRRTSSMTPTRKKWSGLLILMALVVAACGGDTATTTTAGGEPTTTVAEQPSTTAGGEPTTTGAADPLEELIAQAQEEGELTVYWGVDEETGTRVKEAFEAAYDVTFNFERIPGNVDLANRFNTEMDSGAGSAEILVNTDTVFMADALGRGLLVPVADWGIPAIEGVPEVFKAEPYITAGLFRLDNLVLNTETVAEAERPTTWTDLAAPEWQGRMVSNDPRTVFTTLAIFALLEENYGIEWVEAMGQADLQLTESLVTGAQIVAAGERDLAFGIGQIHLNAMLADAPDAPVELIRMEGPEFGAQWNVALSTGGNEAAGRLFINWLFTEEGQQTFNQIIGPAVLPGVEIEGFPALSENYVPLIATTPEEHQDILEALQLN